MAKRKTGSVKVLADSVVMVPVADLQPHPRNPRQGDVGAICESIKANGFYAPLIVQRSTSYILAGNHRWLAAREIGLERVPVAWVDVDDDRALRILLVDNRANDLAAYNDAALASLLQEIVTETGSLEGTGFDGDALDELLADLDLEAAGGTAGLTEDDEVPEPPTIPVSRLGDLWLLGEHRVLCGDSTSSEDVARLLDGAKPFLMCTDPPYGVEYDPEWRNEVDRANGKPYGASAVGKVANDDEVDWTPAYKLFPGDVVYCWHAGRHASEVALGLAACGFLIRNQIIWAKPRFVISRGAYHWQHEPCWYAVRKGKSANWCGDRTQSTLWEVEHQKSETGHGTQKPIELMRRPILNHTDPGAQVYDPFLGSGSTLIACEKEGRICFGNDIDPKYVDVIVKRWQDYTGKSAVLDGDGRTFADVAAERAPVASAAA